MQGLPALAQLIPAGETPCLGKIFALLRFDGLQNASFGFIIIIHTGTILFFHQRQRFPVRSKNSMIPDEVIFRDVEKLSDCGDLLFGNSDRTFPLAAGSAAFTLK